MNYQKNILLAPLFLSPKMWIWCFFWVLSLPILNAQIRLANASFEGKPQDSSLPIGWLSCKAGSTPDILPGPWGVYQEPVEGDTYIGLITREDGTWENIGQKLTQALKGGGCYMFNIYLAHARTYAGYNIPVRLRIWGGQNACTKDELLAESSVIKNDDWKQFSFDFTPSKDIQYLILEAYYAPGIYFPYRGNILLDGCSPIMRCPRAFAEVAPTFTRG